MQRPITVITASLALLSAVPAFAAPSVAGDDRPLQATGLVNVIQVRDRGFRLEATVNTLYDSNFIRQTPGRDAFRITPQVSAGIGLPVGRQQFFLGGFVGRDIFTGDGNERFNSNRFGVGGGLKWRVGSRCEGSVAGELFESQNLVSEVAEFVDNVQQSRSIGASATCQGPVGIGFGGTVRGREVENDRLERQVFNLRSVSVAPQISYVSPALGQFSLGGSWEKVTYPNRPIFGPDGFENDGIKVLSGRLGYSRNLGTRLQLALGLSYIDVEPQPISEFLPGPTGFVLTPRPGSSGLGYDGSLTYRAGSRLTVTASANRSANSTANVGASFVIDKAFGLDFDYRLTPAITAGLGGTINSRDYRGSFISQDEQFLRVSDDTKRVYAQLSYAPVPLYSIDFEVAHQKRDSQPVLFDFTSTTAQLRLRVRFGRG